MNRSGAAHSSARSVAQAPSAGAGHVEAVLGNNARKVSTRERASACRSVRYRLREAARPHQRGVNARKCGRVPHQTHVTINRRIDDGSAHFHGLIRCGSWAACPVCQAQIQMRRSEEVRFIADAHRAAGGGLYLVTFTLPHDQGDRLLPLYRAVTDSYRYVRSGSPWYRAKEAIGYVGEIRALEATVGVNGWHPHLHVLLLTRRALSANEMDDLRAYYFGRWSTRVERFGYRAPSQEHGVTIVASHRDDYVAKMGLADELVKGSGKAARGESQTPVEVLAQFAEGHDEGDLTLWREWVAAMYGARQLTRSRGLRELYGAEPELTDAEVVADDAGGAEESVATLDAKLWRSLVRENADIMWRLLDAAESGGTQAVVDLVADCRVSPARRLAQDRQ